MADSILALAAGLAPSIPTAAYTLATKGKDFMYNSEPVIPVEEASALTGKDITKIKKGLPSIKDALFGIPTEKAVEIRDGRISLNSLRHLVGAGGSSKKRILGSLLATVPLGTSLYAASKDGMKDPEKTGLVAGAIAGTSSLLGNLLINKENAKLDKKTAELLGKSSYNLKEIYKDFYKTAGKSTAKKNIGLALALAGISTTPFVVAKTRQYLDDRNKNFIERLFS